MKELIERILEHEWEMFDKVNNEGGRASCQNDRQTFMIMRKSQFEAWTKDVLESYFKDIMDAETFERNLLTEKYAYMMEFTAPAQFAAMKDVLPEITEEKQKLVDEICEIEMEWTEDMCEKYPLTAKRGRPIHSYEDGPMGVSVETYMIGELKTYSEETLELFLNMIKKYKEEGKNLPIMILENTSLKYGYSSVDEAEETFRKMANK